MRLECEGGLFPRMRVAWSATRWSRGWGVGSSESMAARKDLRKRRPGLAVEGMEAAGPVWKVTVEDCMSLVDEEGVVKRDGGEVKVAMGIYPIKEPGR